MKKIFICTLFVIALMLGHVHALAESYNAVPSHTQVFLNSEPLVIEGLEINGQMHFSMGEIARMLHGTRARFDFTDDSPWLDRYSIQIHRWSEFDPQSYEPAALESGIATPVIINLRILMARDGWFSEVTAFEVNDNFYFALCDLSYIHGYIYRMENATVYIDTMESDINEYGFIVARDFLSARPTLFTRGWTEDIRKITPSYRQDWWPEGHYNFPFSYRLYDFNNDGIPDILIWYDFVEEGMWGIHVLYVYENGKFVRVGRLSYWGELFTDGRGNFYSLEGSHQEGFARIIHFAFTDEGVVWETLANRGVSVWHLPLSEDERATLLEQSEAMWRKVSFSPPSFGGVPLMVVKPFELPELFEAAAQNSIVPQEIPAIPTEIEPPDEYLTPQEELLEEIVPEVTTADYTNPPESNPSVIWVIIVPLVAIAAILLAVIRFRK